MSAFGGSSEALELFFAGSNRGFNPSIVKICSTTNSHGEDDDEEDGCACSSCLRFLSAILCRSLFLDNLHGQLMLMVLLSWKTLSSSLFDFQPSHMHLLTRLTWLVMFCIVTESVSHLSVPAVQFGLRASVQDHLWSVNVHIVPTICATVVADLCFLGQRFLFCASSQRVSHGFPRLVCSTIRSCVRV